jgi:hypothetical protein
VHPDPRPGPVLQPERDVVLDALHHKLRARILQDEPDSRGDPDRPECRGVVTVERQRPLDGRRELAGDQSRDGQRERALAGPRRPDDEQDAAGLDIDVDR